LVLSDFLKRASLSRDLLVAAVAVGAVTGLRVLLAPLLYDRAAFLLFTLAVMVSSWLGGRRMGLITTAFATLVGGVLFVRPFSESVPLQDETQLILFAVEGCGITFLAGQMHAERQRAEQQARVATRSRNEISDLIESIQEGLLTFDDVLRLKYVNRAGENMLGRSAGELFGKTIWELFPGMDASAEETLRRLMSEPAGGVCETYYAPWERWFSLNVYPLRAGMSALLIDISARKRAQNERERLIRELQDALAQVRTLRGLIPICAWCKRIRNDQGYWEQLESYIKSHSEADFTHGMCPDCVKKFTRT
jgi:PAS domain S-box-containing protein